MIKYAAIDIGSNAVRLLLSEVRGEGDGLMVKKISWIRMPIRLGADAFLDGRISWERAEKLEKTIRGFRHLIQAYGPKDFMACATSAMRSAENGAKVCAGISVRTGIDIEIIDGQTEAHYLFQNRHEIMTAGKKAVMFIDVGGGSTEITFFSKGRVVASRSFNIGTIRLLNDRVKDKEWTDMQKWVERSAAPYPGVEAIGSGGNINKLFKMAKGKPGKPAVIDKLETVSAKLAGLSFEQRLKTFNLKPDRADVIVPGARLYLSSMTWAGCRKIHVPMKGLADGMVRVLHARNSP